MFRDVAKDLKKRFKVNLKGIQKARQRSSEINVKNLQFPFTVSFKGVQMAFQSSCECHLQDLLAAL